MTKSPAIYQGKIYPGTLEARWAVFFTELNITYVYNHDERAYPIGNGVHYQHDFWLPEYDEMYVEVKNVKLENVVNFAKTIDEPCLLANKLPSTTEIYYIFIRNDRRDAYLTKYRKEWCTTILLNCGIDLKHYQDISVIPMLLTEIFLFEDVDLEQACEKARCEIFKTARNYYYKGYLKGDSNG